MIRWWRRRPRRARLVLTGGLLFLTLLVLARVHACACTGGPIQWRIVDPAADNNNQE